MPIKDQLHVDHIEPAAKLETDLFKVAYFFKIKSRMQSDTGSLIGIDTCNDGTMSQVSGEDNQLLQEQRTKATTMVMVMNVH